MMLDTVDVSSDLRAALRRLAKAVAIISCCYENQRFAIAATAVNEVSLQPPTMLACVNRQGSMHVPLSRDAAFCINILHESQAEISALCSGKAHGEMRFSQGAWDFNDKGVPFLRDAQASIFCQTDLALSRGTHTVFIGNVFEVRQHGPVAPLVYVDGRYAALASVDC